MFGGPGSRCALKFNRKFNFNYFKICRNCINTSAKNYLICPSENMGKNFMKANSGETDHLTVTADAQRDPELYFVKITKIRDLSPTVKELQLCSTVLPALFTFKPGQWVDLIIPGIDKVGGFSMTSSSTHLRETGEFHLAVKCSENPPSKWVHSSPECIEECKLTIRVGGDFFLDVNKLVKSSGDHKLLLIAGGVGINPLASMISEIKDITDRNVGFRDKIKTALLFSAKSSEELLFREKFDALAQEDTNFKPQYFITGNNMQESRNEENLYKGRISQSHLEKTIQEHLMLQPNSKDIEEKLLTYVCGPPSMITFMESSLRSLGVTRIFYENWWQ